MSVTHDALGTVRVMQSLGMSGAAIGRSAYICTKYSVSPREAYEKYLDEMKSIWALPGKYVIDSEMMISELRALPSEISIEGQKKSGTAFREVHKH